MLRPFDGVDRTAQPCHDSGTTPMTPDRLKNGHHWVKSGSLGGWDIGGSSERYVHLDVKQLFFNSASRVKMLVDAGESILIQNKKART